MIPANLELAKTHQKSTKVGLPLGNHDENDFCLCCGRIKTK
jgi:hypothetical protein